MKVTTKGQVTIPQEIRERLGLLPQTEVEFEIEGDAVRIRKKRGSRRRGEQLIRHMTGRGTVKMTTEQIMRLTRGDE